MNTETRVMSVIRSKKGYPTSWESGGGMSHTGRAFGWAKADGSKKKAICIKKRCNDNHALFFLENNDIMCNVYESSDGVSIKLEQIIDIANSDNNTANITLKQIGRYSDGEWDNDPSELIEEFVRSMISKARDYHCRIPYWAILPEPRY